MIISFALHLLCSIVSCIPTHPPPPGDLADLKRVTRGDQASENIVTLRHGGSLEGFTMKNYRGEPLRAFQSIPYAHPPLGHLRFQPPKPIEGWSGILQAKKRSPTCLQVDLGQYYRIEGQEDCLYLNVYAPLPQNRRLPVLIYLHGGAYFFGAAAYYGPAYFGSDVILVTINYRLGALGFLSTGDEICPGNNGMKDQVLAIKWVLENIEFFGGDPEKVILWGQSAGGSSVQLHLVSNLTRNLTPPIWGAIAQSGLAFSHWSVVNNTVRNSRKLARGLGCDPGQSGGLQNSEDSKEMVNCLRGVNANLLALQQMNIYKWMIYPMMIFGPVIESESPGAFLTASPEVLYARGDVLRVPMVAGLTADEGDFFALQQIHYPIILASMDSSWNEKLPIVLDFKNRTRDSILDPLDLMRKAGKLRKYYFGESKVNYWSRGQLSKILGDRMINQGVYKGLQAHSKVAPTFGYLFTFRGDSSIVGSFGSRRSDWGVTHVDDLQYLLNSTYFYPAIRVSDRPEYEMTDFLTNTWTNFASNGTPFYILPDGEEIQFWTQIDPDAKKMEILEIGRDPRMISFPNDIETRLKFLQDIGI